MRNPLVSIVIPNYNNSLFIEKCITSVLNQSYDNLEIIVVDDLSTDNSRKIINKLSQQDNRIVTIFLAENKGVSHARNTGLSYAKGEYVTCLDGDDFYYNENKIENEVYILINKNIDKSISFSRIMYVDEIGNVIDSKLQNTLKTVEGKIYNKLLFEIRSSNIPRDFLYSRKLFALTGGYDESMSLYEDYDYLLRLSKIAIFYYTNDFGTAYRQKNYGLSQRPTQELLETKGKIIKQNLAEVNMLRRNYIRFCRTVIKIISSCNKMFKSMF